MINTNTLTRLRITRLGARSCALFISAALLAFTPLTQAQLNADAEDPCWVQDQSGVAPALIYSVVMIDDPSSDPEEVQAIFGRALIADCNVNDTDDTGSSALTYAIIFNRPAMAEQLLNAGANAYVRRHHSKPQLNGKNAFEILEIVSQSQPLTDRSALREIFERQHARRVSKSR